MPSDFFSITRSVDLSIFSVEIDTGYLVLGILIK